MSIATAPRIVVPPRKSLADLLKQLGGVPAKRVLADPPPGSATPQDVLDRKARLGQLCELVDGVLVEKPMGFEESMIAMEIGFQIKQYLKQHKIGFVMGTDGPIRTQPNQIRMPDVSFVRKGRLPANRPRREAILHLAPDLAIEVLSRSNTAAEMRRKTREYFESGVQLVWIIDPRRRTARIYTAVDAFQEIDESGFLVGGDVLPGFKLRLKTLLDEALEGE
jgi:Uma2 family endonuclease